MTLYIGPHMMMSDFNNNILNICRSVKSMGGNCLQIFLGDNQKLALKYKYSISNEIINETNKFIKNNKMKIYVHLNLSLNLCSKEDINNKNIIIKNIKHDIKLGNKIGISGYVVHLGYWRTKSYDIGEKKARKNYINQIKYLIKNVKEDFRILIETDVDVESRIDGKIEGLAEIYNTFTENEKKKVGICIDTAHIFSAGYDLRDEKILKEYFNKIDKLIGYKNIDLIHLNDSKVPLNSKIDRHESLTKGYIFNPKLEGNKKSLEFIVKIAYKNNIAMVLETRDFIYFKKEIELVKKYSKLNKNFKKKNQKGGKKIQTDYTEKIIEKLEELRDLHIILKNVHEAKAYTDVIQTLKYLNKPIYNSNNLKDTPTIGKRTLEKIDEIIKTDELQIIKDIKKNKEIKDILELTKVLGIGPSVARKLVDHKIRNIKELKKLAEDYEQTGIKKVINFNEMQLIGIKYYKDLLEKIPRNEITKTINYLKSKLNKNVKFKDLELILAGSYRTGKLESKDIDLIIINPKLKTEKELNKSNLYIELINYLQEDNILKDFVNIGKNHALGIIKTPENKYNRHIDIRIIPEEIYPYYILYFGSGTMFSRKIRHYASKHGYKLSENELLNLITGKKIKAKKEEDIFKELKLKYLKPENRTNPIKVMEIFNK